MPERRLLIIDDDAGFVCAARRQLEGVATFVAAHARDAEAILRKEEPQVVMLELAVTEQTACAGPTLLETVSLLLPHAKVVVCTRTDAREHAVRAVAAGAHDVLHKPVDARTLAFTVERAFRLAELEAEARRSRQLDRASLAALITRSADAAGPGFHLERVAAADSPVLLLGEAGTCKAMIARAIHELSSRATGPFTGVDCGALRGKLGLDGSDLDPARYSNLAVVKLGDIARTSGGTLLLANVDEAPLRQQARILKLLTKLARTRAEQPPVAPRVISTCSRDVGELVLEGSLRPDLADALAAVTVPVPPLRERAGDIVSLAKSLLARHMGDRPLHFSKDCMAAMETWAWPGNIRELDNRIKRACMTAAGRFITPRDLGIAPDEEEAPLNLKRVRTGAERSAIQRALDRSNDNVSQAARLLGISRPTLYNLFSKHGLRVREPS